METINGRVVDGYIVTLENRAKLPAYGRWAIYPVSASDGFGRTIFHEENAIGSARGYDIPEDAAIVLAKHLSETR